LGLGLQFAVVAARCLKEAEKKGLGHELPTDWFTEKEHP
jgi:alanine dehydrogenase